MMLRPRRVRRYASLLAGPLLLLGMAFLPSAAAAPVSSTQAGAGSAVARPSAAEPKLTTSTRAGCNTKQKRGYARCFAVVRTPADHQVTPFAAQPPATALGPADIQDAYNLPSGAGARETVAIVDAFGYSAAEDDLAVFRSYYGLPPCTTDNGCFTKVDQRGGTDYPPSDAGWAIETALDVDAVSSACPACHILLVEADDNYESNLTTAVDEAVALGAKYVSNSYGGGDIGYPGSYDTHYDHPGVAVVASSGDTGNAVDWPSSIPTVTSAGGTLLTKDTSVPRGWTETPWTGGGSGCSSVEPKPDYQSANGLDTHCDMRATADIAADAAPASGLGIYDSFGQSGWLQVGGTSLSSPLLTAMYALAATPVPGTYPVTYPYDPAAHEHLFDITTGSNGTCGNVLCTAGPGWDGPTGWGTPNGVQALTTGPHGDIAGQVTDKGSGDPIAGATVSAGDYAARTDEQGRYDLAIPVGSHDLTASMFGYKPTNRDGVQVTEDETTTVEFALTAVPSTTLSGTVTDGSGHGWPLYAKITIDGYPHGAIYTNPFTGHYSVDLPQQATYTLHVAPVSLPGYQTADLLVDVGTGDARQDVAVPVKERCMTAPGYAPIGTHEEFTGWARETPQDGWTVVDNLGNGNTWLFRSPGQASRQTIPPGSDGYFAVMESDAYATPDDTSLVSPVVDLPQQTAPAIVFDTNYRAYTNSTADVDLSLDAGQTWTNVWHHTTDSVDGSVSIPIPQASGRAAVQVRFHYTGQDSRWWSLDNVRLGSCSPVPGGLVEGAVTDGNTGYPVNGATVASNDPPNAVGVSAATPDDPNLADGLYWLFSSSTGDRGFTVSNDRYDYAPVSATVNVAADQVTRQDWALRAGHLTATPDGISVTEPMGKSISKTVTLTNDGTVPVHVQLGEQNTGFTPMVGRSASPRGAPLEQVKAPVTLAAMAGTKTGAMPKSKPPAQAPTPHVPPWTDIPAYPTPIMDNAVAYHNGKVYSVGGVNGDVLKSSYVYDPVSSEWSPIADAPARLEHPAAAFLGDSMYLVGGYNGSSVSDSVYAYRPDNDTWSQVADLPAPLWAAATAVLDGQLYVVGGCTTASCPPVSASVYRYDPDGDKWTQLADYPTPVAYGACAGALEEVVCAGGNTGTQSLTSTHIYHPDTDTWFDGADMPYDNWGMVSSGSNDRLQIVAGVRSGAITNRAAEYDPATDTWSALPNANNAEYRGGGSCGLYQIGGDLALPGFWAQQSAEVLPGYQCGTTDLPWLTESATDLQLDAGKSATVTVTLDASAVSQPGGYAAALWMSTDTPYHPQLVVAMQVDPPKSWGKVDGTVTDAGTSDPIAGATVAVCVDYRQSSGGCGPMTYPVKTDQSGHYQLWLDQHDSPLQVSAAKDGYQPQATIARLKAGKTTTVTFALKRS